MIKTLSDTLTEKDGETLCPARILSVIAVLVGLGLQIASFVTGKPFDILAYGGGCAAMITGLGASLSLKYKTEQ